MPDNAERHNPYFDLSLQMSLAAWQRYGLSESLLPFRHASLMLRLRAVADTINRTRAMAATSAGELNLAALLTRVFRHLTERYLQDHNCRVGHNAITLGEQRLEAPRLAKTLQEFTSLFPPAAVRDGKLSAERFLADDDNRRATLVEMFILSVQNTNPALGRIKELFDDEELTRRSAYRSLLAEIDRGLEDQSVTGLLGRSLLALLEEPVRRAPDSLHEQLRFVRTLWRDHLPPDVQEEILTAFDIVEEETRMRGFGPGRTEIPNFRPAPAPDEYYPEPEAFTADADWMSNVVLIAKSTYVWLDQLSQRYQRPITRVDQIPDEELDQLARWGFNCLWLIGIWERSTVSQWIKHMRGNPEALASAYSLYDYVIANDLGGEEAMAELEERCRQRGIRLASDIVPNHTGIYSRWLKENPDWYVQLDYPPYPSYRFTGRDLSPDPELSIQIEDGYYDHSDAAVVFKLTDHRDGRVRYIYHGNDGTHMPWNDTAQLNYLLPAVREAMVQTILHIARRFKVIRFDAAMTLAKKHFQRLWFPQPGGGAGVPSRAEHAMTRAEFEKAFPKEFWREVVDRVAAEVPDTLLIAEAFWLMEGYFVRTLGMHRVYNSAFMNMLKNEENAKYRLTIKNILEFNHEILKRFTNFMNNPDEATAVEQFGKGEKYYGVATMLATMPGLPMFGHGQVEGLSEKYGMEYSKAYWDEPIDSGMVSEHERRIFPLLRRRYIFSGSRDFRLYDFWTDQGVDENVFAYSNRCGDQRALVVFHNRYAEISGWVRTTAAWAVDPSGNPGWLEQSTLGHSLDLKSDSHIYYRFREHVSGQQFLRTGREMVEQGLFVRLEGYQCQVFIDFEEIHDHDGTWSRIYQELAGAPCADLDRLWRRRQYAELIESLDSALAQESLLDLERSLAQPKEKIKSGKHLIDIERRFGYFWKNIVDEFSLYNDSDQLTAGLKKDISALQRLRSLRSRQLTHRETLNWLQQHLPGTSSQEKPADKKAKKSPGHDKRCETLRLLLPWLLWHRLDNSGKNSTKEVKAEDLAWRCLFDEVWVETLTSGSAPYFNLGEEQARLEAERIVRLLARRPVPTTAGQLTQLMADLLNDRDARSLLGYNIYQKIEWFDQERFTDFVDCICLLGALALSLGEEKKQTLMEGVAALHNQSCRINSAAAAAGFQVQPMVRRLREMTPPPRSD